MANGFFQEFFFEIAKESLKEHLKNIDKRKEREAQYRKKQEENERRKIEQKYNGGQSSRSDPREAVAQQHVRRDASIVQQTIYVSSNEPKQEMRRKEKKGKGTFIIILLFIVVFAGLWAALLITNSSKVYMPVASSELEGLQVEEVVAILEEVGFTDFTKKAEKVLSYDQCSSQNTVCKITIKKESSFAVNTQFNTFSTVYITYLMPAEVSVPSAIFENKKMDYATAYSELVGAGFGNIQLVAKGDIITGWRYAEGQIDEITVNTKKAKDGAVYPVNAEIIITYHSKPVEE